MKPIENIFGFDCVTCEHNRHCYGGDMGNQFRYCQKSAEKIQNLDKLQQENKQLEKENQELKLELSGYRQAILEDKDMLGLKEENDKLKKQLEEYENEPLTNKISRIDCVVSNIYSRNKNQQKEFIEYLEDYLKLFDKMDIDAKISYDMLEEILSKYKEIIGGKE